MRGRGAHAGSGKEGLRTWEGARAAGCACGCEAAACCYECATVGIRDAVATAWPLRSFAGCPCVPPAMSFMDVGVVVEVVVVVVAVVVVAVFY